MEPASVATGLLALLVILTRAPFIVWPLPTLDRFQAAIATRTGVRLLGALIANRPH